MLLSIVIPSIPSRINKFFIPLYDKINSQVSKYDNIEILAFFDNKKRSIGYKRDALVQLAKGDYIVMVDDDDDISDTFVDEIMSIIDGSDIDLVTFNTGASINGGNLFTVRYDLTFENEEAHQVNDQWVDIKRKPFHNMVWKTSIAKSERFPDASYGEDYHWAKRLHPKVRSSRNIDKILMFYRYNDKVTEAEYVFPQD